MRIRETANELGRALGTVLVPFRCRSCRRILGGPPRLLCVACYRVLRTCDIPDTELPGRTAGERACRAVSYYRTGSPLRVIHRAAKYRTDLPAARWLGQYLVRGMTDRRRPGGSFRTRSVGSPPSLPNETRRTLCIPMPSHPSRLRDRGLDLTGILAQHVADAFSLDLATDILIRTRLGSPQNDLDRDHRLQNVRGVFKVTRTAPEGGAVVLIDDVVTTGATLDAASTALEGSGWRVHLQALAFRRELFAVRSAE